MANIFGTLNPKGIVGGGGSKSTFFTTTIPTFDNVNYVYVLAKTDVSNGTGATFNTGDLVEYINASGKLDAVFTITAVGSTDLTLSFIASIPPYENGCWILDTTNLTLDSGNYYIGELSDIDNRNGKEIKVGDVLIGTDGNIYTLYLINGTEIVVVLAVNGSGGGKQLYQHNITWTNSSGLKASCVIINDSDTPMDYTAFYNYLNDNGYTSNNGKYLGACSCFVYSDGFLYICQSFAINNVTTYASLYTIREDTKAQEIYRLDNKTIEDKVIAL